MRTWLQTAQHSTVDVHAIVPGSVIPFVVDMGICTTGKHDECRYQKGRKECRFFHQGESADHEMGKCTEYLNISVPLWKRKVYKYGHFRNRMEDHFDAIPVPYRTERLGRMRDLILQIEADYKGYQFLKQRVDKGVGDNSDMEELGKREAWIKRSMTTFMRSNAMSIEGITFVRIGEFSSQSCLKKK